MKMVPHYQDRLKLMDLIRTLCELGVISRGDEVEDAVYCSLLMGG